MNKNISSGSKLFITEGIALFSGGIFDTEIHAHNAIQISIGMESDFIFETDDEAISTRLIIINSNFKHKLIGKNGTQLLVLIEPESIYGESLGIFLGNKQYFQMSHDEKLLDFIDTNINSNSNLFKISDIIKTLLDSLEINIEYHSTIDHRVVKAMGIIDQTVEKKLSIKELADKIFLSESRLQHLFKLATGISIKRYLLWKKMIDGINIIVSGKDFTYSSYAAGFADSAHMSRTFKEMFGINLLDVFKVSRSVQVIRCKR